MLTFFHLIFNVEFGYAVFRVTTPILFAALAALIASKGGVMNISLEGTMLFSALSGVIVSAYTHSAFLGVLGAMATGILMSLLLAYCALDLKTDIFLTGIALNMLASGGTVFLLYILTNDKGMSGSLKSLVVPNIKLPLIQDIPIIGPIISNHNILTYLSLISVVIVYLLIYKMPIGLKIRAVGENPGAAASVGVNVRKIKYMSLMLSGLFASLGGAFMSMGYVSWFSRDMIAGRGFIGLAAEAMGRGTPLGTFLSSAIFGVANAVSNSLQAMSLPAQFVQMIPYATTIIGLLLYSIQQTNKSIKAKNTKELKQ
ncbi:ABC transporter permease [Paenibacillus pectinilyticus]|uniref:ABC transporter permease n=1 Tax=Paenibacillus pectinilyticus TaxID=512399 RepID=A0A1C1A2I4_9BACL|nr:ABC transporter permease [Paenibacillus pectinilyticus]OCT14736.1 ABC transporter permease [Paenibacillus pectinilyticus]